MILSKTTPTYSLLFFEMTIFRNSILSGTDGILLSITEIPHDEILEGLYKLRIRESENLKTVLELYDLETHPKKLGPDYHRLKTMVKRSIEQEIRNKNIGSRTGNFEKNAVVQNHRIKQRVQRILGDCWQCETDGQCVKECLFYKTKSGCRFGESAHSHIVRLMNSRQKGLKKNDVKSAVAMLKKGDWQERETVTDECHDRPGKPGKRSDKKLGQNSSKRQSSDARQLGCVFQDMMPPKSILRKGTDMPKPIQRVKFTKAIARHSKIRDQNLRSDTFAQGNLISAAPTLQNLRIGLRRRQSGKSKVSAKQRGSWPKVC